MTDKKFTLQEKAEWLSNHLGKKIEETELHGPGQFEAEVNQDFDALYKPEKPFEFTPFQFKKYSSIENTYRKKEIDRIVEQGNSSGLWRVSEKVHGCLTWDCEVETLEFGKIPIGKIIDEKLECKIKSVNVETNEIEWKRVLGFSIKENNGDWYEIQTIDGKKLQITGSHYVWLPNLHIWRKVEDLTENDEFLVD
jgi:hypothetical protein